jgi:hypothetical protein
MLFIDLLQKACFTYIHTNVEDKLYSEIEA